MKATQSRLAPASPALRRRRERILKIAGRVMGPERLEALLEDRARVEGGDNPFGYDPFGLEIEAALTAMLLLHPLYKRWFRVESEGIANVPDKGRALIVSNHSGVLPLDGMAIAMNCALEMRHPRLVRAIIERFFAKLPYGSLAMQRIGQVVGTARNFEWLLSHEELVAVFPEGAKGTGKLYSRRYKMVHFNVGFLELALKHQCPIIPTCVIGGEEQYRMLYDVKPLAKAIGFPYFPLTPLWPWTGPLGFVPFPVKYKIYYGEPIHLYREYGPETLEDPKKVRQLVEQVKAVIQSMIDSGLKRRKSIWTG